MSNKTNNHQFNSDGWPINPYTGHPYTRDQIIVNPNLPLPIGVDPNHPYWRRRTPAQLQEEKDRLNKKLARCRSRSRSRRRRSTRTAPPPSLLPDSSYFDQETRRHHATAEQLDRLNRNPTNHRQDQSESRAVLFSHAGHLEIMEV